MFKGDSADTWAGKFHLLYIFGGLTEGVCTDNLRQLKMKTTEKFSPGSSEMTA